MTTDELGKSEKEARIQELLEVKAGGVSAGVCGREFCEVCGQEGSFSGFLGAMWAHTSAGHFICWNCRQEREHSLREGGTPPTLDKLILERGYRYCEGCGRKVKLAENTLEEALKLPFSCPACHGIDRGQAARRRYLGHEATKQGGLEKAAAHIYWAKAGIEELLGEED